MALKDKLSCGIANLLKLKVDCYLNLVNDIGLSDITLKQINYLKIMNKSNRLTTSQLAETLNLSKPTVTEMIKKFIKLDCVYKQSCAADGRVYYLKLTERGKRIAELDILTNDYLADILIDKLDEEDIKILIGILKKIE